MPFLGKQPTAGFASIVKDDLTPNGSTTAFTLSKQVANANDIAVFLGNVRQEPTDAYTVSGTTLTMSEAPASGLNFYVLHIAGTVESSVVPADDTISTAKIVNDAVTSAKIGSNIVLTGDSSDGVEAFGVNTTNVSSGTFKWGSSFLAPNMTDSQVFVSIVGKAESNSNAAWIGFKNSATQNERAVTIGMYGKNHIIEGDYQGRVKLQYQPYFYAKNTGAGSENGDGVTTTPIIFPTAVKDVGGHLSNTNSRFTAPVDGLYFFTGVPGYKQSSADFAVRLSINGTHLTDVVRLIGSGITSHAGLSFGANIYLNANDYVELVSVSGAYHRNNNSVPNWWSGGLLWGE